VTSTKTGWPGYGARGPAMTFVMLKLGRLGSQSRQERPDHIRCTGFTSARGTAAYRCANSTPSAARTGRDLLTCADPEGPPTDTGLGEEFQLAGHDGRHVVVACGMNASHAGARASPPRPDRVPHLACLGVTQSGAGVPAMHTRGPALIRPHVGSCAHQWASGLQWALPALSGDKNDPSILTETGVGESTGPH